MWNKKIKSAGLHCHTDRNRTKKSGQNTCHGTIYLLSSTNIRLCILLNVQWFSHSHFEYT
uniref:Uncharacterized protein n=1 Tax=Anguilla anguilla TaxID=7936 RepID=A0A0E9SFD2_ANGAN